MSISTTGGFVSIEVLRMIAEGKGLPRKEFVWKEDSQGQTSLPGNTYDPEMVIEFLPDIVATAKREYPGIPEKSLFCSIFKVEVDDQTGFNWELLTSYEIVSNFDTVH